jgi:RNA polymerase subunit RPABC4/transcription elongation factor Spt4
MSAPKGKISALVLLVLVVVFVGFVLTPLAIAPLGVFTGLARGTRQAFFSGWHNIPWFPFVPLWSFSLLFVVIWFVVILWVYRDAERRRMSGLLWALLVFIGNLIGLLIYLIVRQDHPCCDGPAGSPAPSPPTVPTVAAKKSSSCPACQKPVEAGFVYCPHCGASLQKACPSCGKPAESDWKVCPRCGAPLKSE